MRRALRSTARRTAMVVAACIVALLARPGAAAAIVVGAPTTTLDDYSAGAVTTYTFAGYTTDGNRRLAWAEVTFPAGTDVSGATAVLPGTAVTRTGQTVRVTYSPSVAGNTAFTVAIGGIVNPTAGTYSVGTILCRTTNPGGQQARNENVPTAGYTIVAPSLTMTITTPDAGQSVEFGSIDPGVTPPPRSVTVTVVSSSAYTLTRTITGDVDPMGLVVSGDAEGAKSAGTATYTDDYQLTPPWTTDPDTPLVATVVYTVTQ